MDWTLITGGCLVGFFGWIVYRAGLPVIGALIGATTLGSIGYLVGDYLMASMNLHKFILPMAVGGMFVAGILVGIFAINALQLYFFFITGASFGAAIGLWISALPVVQNTFDKEAGAFATLIIAGVTAFICGMLLVKFRRFIIAVVTSVLGGLMVCFGLPTEGRVIGLVVSVATFLVIQIGFVRRFVDKETFDAKTSRKLREDKPDV
jgi:hypothetical protein